jgi:hypothetical protein
MVRVMTFLVNFIAALIFLISMLSVMSVFLMACVLAYNEMLNFHVA